MARSASTAGLNECQGKQSWDNASFWKLDVCLCHCTALFQYRQEQGDPGGKKAVCKEGIVAQQGAAAELSGQAVPVLLTCSSWVVKVLQLRPPREELFVEGETHQQLLHKRSRGYDLATDLNALLSECYSNLPHCSLLLPC